MNVTLSKAQAEFLEQVRHELADIPPDEREEVIGDLEAHLVELDDEEIEPELGTPEAFAREFRISAGWENPTGRQRFGGLRMAASGVVRPLGNATERLAEVTRWDTVRPVWVWIRGWLMLGAWTAIQGNHFQYFLVPNYGNSLLLGVLFVAIATALSVGIDRPWRGRWGRGMTRLFSAVAAGSLLLSMFNPLPDPHEQWVDPYESIDQLIAPGGEPVDNIYAFDTDGEPVDVLLYDQDGDPLLTRAERYYEAYRVDEQSTAQEVRFHRDEFGRVVPNLYPVTRFEHDGMGRWREVPPPAIGFPDVEAEGGTVTTTTSIPLR